MKMNVFEKVIATRRGDVLRWLCSRYSDLREDDGKDIIQDSCCELWKWGSKKSAATEDDYFRMWKKISRNLCTHWLAKQHHTEEWNDQRLQYGWEERDYGWSIGNEAQHQKRELFYRCLEAMNDKDRRLIEMLLTKTKMKDIALALGYKSEQVAKNRKHVLLKAMQKTLSSSALSANVVNPTNMAA